MPLMVASSRSVRPRDRRRALSSSPIRLVASISFIVFAQFLLFQFLQCHEVPCLAQQFVYICVCPIFGVQEINLRNVLAEFFIRCKVGICVIADQNKGHRFAQVEQTDLTLMLWVDDIVAVPPVKCVSCFHIYTITPTGCPAGVFLFRTLLRLLLLYCNSDCRVRKNVCHLRK